MNLDTVLRQGCAAFDAGNLPEAETIFRRILAKVPDHPESVHRLGLIAYKTGHVTDAIQLLDRSCALQPQRAEYLTNLGAVLASGNYFAQAIEAFEHAMAMKPDLTDNVINLANVLIKAGRPAEAIPLLRRALAKMPDNVRALHALGSALANTGDVNGAIGAYSTAARLRPDLPEPLTNLGDALNEAGRPAEAVEACRRAVAIRPNFAEAYNNMGRAHLFLRQIPEAIDAFRRAQALDPKMFQVHNNLGSLLKDIGDLDEAVACYQRALDLRPDFSTIDSNRVYTLLFHPGWDAPSTLRELKLWNTRHALPLRDQIRPHDSDRSPDRRLRVGYVSPDFRDHVVGQNILPLLREHDRNSFEVFCYANHYLDEPGTTAMKRVADHWRVVSGMPDVVMAETIRADKIDILVDLSLHMARNRLPVFARKPAPIQVTFGGYPGGTGMETMDYRLTDPYLDPPENDAFYVEQSIRLPDSFWCYDMEGMGLDKSPPVNELPARSAGHVTFGCLNNLCKINPAVLDLWRRVLDAVPGSRLLVLAPPGDHLQRLSERMNGRVDFANWLPRMEYLAGYHQIDLGLDTFPYNGHTTSLDSLWMGVPVITLVGQTAVARAGWSQLCNLNLRELAAHTPDEFVAIATTLAADLPRLANLRATLRDRLKSSPLMDGARFTRNIESAYRQMWHRWCRS